MKATGDGGQVEHCNGDLLNSMTMAAHASIRPLLLSHALPHIKSHGFTSQALSLASLSLPAPYHYSAPLPPAGITALFGKGREPERALVKEWLADRRKALEVELKVKGKAGRPSLEDVLQRRLEMNEEVRPWLADVRVPPLCLSAGALLISFIPSLFSVRRMLCSL